MFKNKPVIGIIPTFNLGNEDPYLDKISFVSMYEEKISNSGGIPIGLLNDNLIEYKSLCDGYLIPGGTEINPKVFPIIKDAIENKKPLLGICLGMQTIATYFNLIQNNNLNNYNVDLDNYLKFLVDDSKHNFNITKDIDVINKARHLINIKPESLLYKIYKEKEINVVSLHKYIVPFVSSDVMVSAVSNDSVIEAIEYRNNGANIIGVQFHPEIDIISPLFDWLVDAAYKKELLLVNKEIKIPDNYNLKIIKYHSLYPECINESDMALSIYDAWIQLRDYMRSKGYFIDVESAYRTHEMQEELFNEVLKEKGIEHACIFVAKPGYSEHETGLAIDVCMKLGKVWLNEFNEKLNEFYSFLNKIIADYGFILRYPSGKESITGYHFEPWHIRYIGSPRIAHDIMDNNLTLEEYLNNNY